MRIREERFTVTTVIGWLPQKNLRILQNACPSLCHRSVKYFTHARSLLYTIPAKGTSTSTEMLVLPQAKEPLPIFMHSVNEPPPYPFAFLTVKFDASSRLLKRSMSQLHNTLQKVVEITSNSRKKINQKTYRVPRSFSLDYIPAMKMPSPLFLTLKETQTSQDTRYVHGAVRGRYLMYQI